MFAKRILIAAVLAGSIATTGAAFAQGQPIVGISTVTTNSLDATITAIDPAKRTVTFTGPAGRSITAKVSDGVKMDTSKVGDTVSAAFENKLTFVLSGPNAATPRDRETPAVRAFNDLIPTLDWLQAVIAPFGDGLWVGVKRTT